MAKIKTNIKNKPQNIELCRNRVAEILKDELEYQFMNFYDAVFDADVEVEGSNPYIDKIDCPLVNVSYVKANYANENQGQSDGKYQIFIEAFCNSVSTKDIPGDQKATFDVQKLLGACRYIIKDPIYKLLGYQPGFIIRHTISEAIIYEIKKDDAKNTIGGKLIMIVEVVEDNDLIVAQLADGYTTRARLNLSAQGYKWDYIQYS